MAQKKELVLRLRSFVLEKLFLEPNIGERAPSYNNVKMESCCCDKHCCWTLLGPAPWSCNRFNSNLQSAPCSPIKFRLTIKGIECIQKFLQTFLFCKKTELVKQV